MGEREPTGERVRNAVILLFVAHALVASGVEASSDEEFVGPFDSWLDVKRDFGAVGDDLAAVITILPVITVVDTVEAEKERTVMRIRQRGLRCHRDAGLWPHNRIEIRVFLTVPEAVAGECDLVDANNRHLVLQLD